VAAEAVVGAAAGRIRRAALIVFVACTASARADQIERITDYRSDVTVARDGRLTVQETITVNAQDDNIVHGIFRDFPTIYRASGNVHVAFDVLDATLDGHDTPTSVEDIDNGSRLRMGDSDTTLSPGLHVFRFRYVTDRQIAFLKDRDELYWNVTGTGWDFQIDHAEAVVHLPAGAQITGTNFFTGKQGAHGGNAIARKLAPGAMQFQTTQELDPNQGLTIDVGFAKGAVAPPTRADRARFLLRDNAGVAGALVGLAVLCLYFLVAWWLVGRDPRRGAIIPLFAPPHDLSPAAMRFVHRMRYDRKAFAATLIGLAVKGVAVISETKHFLGPVYTLTPTGESGDDLSAAEAGVAEALLSRSGDGIELTHKNQPRIAMAIAMLKMSLSNECERIYFNRNQSWLWPGLGIIGLSALAAAFLSDDGGGAFLVFLWGGLFGVASAVFCYYAFQAWQSVFAGPGARIVHLGVALLRTLCTLPFVGTLIGVTFFLNNAIQPLTILILGVEGIVAAIFYRLLRAPTRAGQTLRDEIDGFALFLKTAEQPRLETLQPPEITPQLFEKFLPYAVALDCENAWSRKFEAATAAAGTGASESGGTPYMPMWYQGDSFSTLGTAAFASSIGASIGSAVASASVAPGSGGGGGGGFSGGGGGGGGGGGW
jgi:hypothetical protein